MRVAGFRLFHVVMQMAKVTFIYQLKLPPMTVSATQIRKQLISHQLSLTDLPEAVADYIQKNKLYL